MTLLWHQRLPFSSKSLAILSYWFGCTIQHTWRPCRANQTALWLLWHSSCTQLWSRYWARQTREIQMGWSQWKHTTLSDSFFSYPEYPAEDRGLSAGWLSDLSSPHTNDQALLISVELGGSGMPRSKPRPCTPQPPHSSHTRCQGLQQLFLPKPGYSLKMSGP